MSRLGKDISRRGPGHVHHFSTRDVGVFAEYQKGPRDPVFFKGNFEQCDGCPLGRFVPEGRDLGIVECEKIVNKGKK